MRNKKLTTPSNRFSPNNYRDSITGEEIPEDIKYHVWGWLKQYGININTKTKWVAKPFPSDREIYVPKPTRLPYEWEVLSTTASNEYYQARWKEYAYKDKTGVIVHFYFAYMPEINTMFYVEKDYYGIF